MTLSIKVRLPLLFVSLAFALPAMAQTQPDYALQNSTIEQEQAAIQAQITQGVTSGNLSADQIATLQAQQQQLNSLRAVQSQTATTSTASVPNTTVPSPNAINGRLFNQTGPSRTSTGPDPFTYNTLGPDAYAAQKNANPSYNVPAYPTSQPLPANVQQQYSAPSAGAPYGAGYGQTPPPVVPNLNGYSQVPYSGGTTQAPAASGGGSGVYVYHPSMSR